MKFLKKKKNTDLVKEQTVKEKTKKEKAVKTPKKEKTTKPHKSLFKRNKKTSVDTKQEGVVEKVQSTDVSELEAVTKDTPVIESSEVKENHVQDVILNEENKDTSLKSQTPDEEGESSGKLKKTRKLKGLGKLSKSGKPNRLEKAGESEKAGKQGKLGKVRLLFSSISRKGVSKKQTQTTGEKKKVNIKVLIKNILDKVKKHSKGKQGNGEFKRVEKIAWYQGIQMKLWMLVVIPVLFLIVLGTVSFSKASTGIQDGYVNSLSSAVQLTTSYYEFLYDTLKSDYNELFVDTKIKTYVNGGYAMMDSTDGLTLFNEKYKEFNYNITNNKFLKDIYIVTDNDKSITTSNTSVKDLYSLIAETEQGKLAMEEESKYHYFGNMPEVDKALKTKSEDYALRIIHKIPKGTG